MWQTFLSAMSPGAVGENFGPLLICTPPLDDWLQQGRGEAFAEATLPLGRRVERTIQAAAAGALADLESAGGPRPEAVAFLRNPALIPNASLPARAAASIAPLRAARVPWAMIAAGGMGLDGERYCALYSATCPALRCGAHIRPILDCMPDLYILEVDHAKHLASAPDYLAGEAPGLQAILRGYAAGRLSVYSPHLGAGINGPLLGRDFAGFEAEIGALAARLELGRVETLSGPVVPPPNGTAPHQRMPVLSLRERVRRLAIAHSAPPSFSVVSRTQLRRPHLMRRMLASLSRARPASGALEVVLVGDRPTPTQCRALTDLSEEFPTLGLRYAVNRRSEASRVANLLTGLVEATGDYVLILDDDDYVLPEIIEQASCGFFLGQRPLVTLSCRVFHERWDMSGRRPVLAASTPGTVYAADGWRSLLGGVNHMPVCGALIPRQLLLQHAEAAPWHYDLSEDYALFLRLFFGGGIEEVYEAPGIAVGISIREEGENIVTQTDRRDWTHDIAGHLDDLYTSPAFRHVGWHAALGTRAPADAAAALGAAEARIRDLEEVVASQRWLIERLRRQVLTAQQETPA